MKNSFSIIIPAYKEEKFIEETIGDLIYECRQNLLDFELIVVIDKAPDDKTFEIVNNLSKIHCEINIISREKKEGVSSAIQDGINNARNDVLIITIAGNHINANDVILLAKKMDEGFDMVFGDRFTQGIRIPKYPITKLIANRLCNFVIMLLFGIKSNDVTSGIKAYKTSLLKNIPFQSIGFEIFVELPITVFLNGNSNIGIVPITLHERDVMYSHFDLMHESPRYVKTIFKLFFQKIKKQLF
jgi:dolichol-phosphate mannosyltransferase